ncbi:hypothetical protein MGAS15252_0428 [Streptococcus pyogenes MGAS15252]|nr:hypothetical protein MGAS15252_0428 [Streptococcus pyogenes MGAS15252]AFC67649.1 hypothetical protein MGAS1882_0425 [Streptococcus pyogenes MGAS1882]
MEVLKKWSGYHKWRRKRRSKYLFDRDGRCCAGSDSLCSDRRIYPLARLYFVWSSWCCYKYYLASLNI